MFFVTQARKSRLTVIKLEKTLLRIQKVFAVNQCLNNNEHSLLSAKLSEKTKNLHECEKQDQNETGVQF